MKPKTSLIYRQKNWYSNSQLNEDLAGVEKGLNENAQNLQKLQGSDKRLRHCLVTISSLNRDVLQLMGGFVMRGKYQNGQRYRVLDLVRYKHGIYRCVLAHTATQDVPSDAFSFVGIESCGCFGSENQETRQVVMDTFGAYEVSVLVSNAQGTYDLHIITDAFSQQRITTMIGAFS